MADMRERFDDPAISEGVPDMGDRSEVATALTRQLVYRNCGLPSPLDAHRADSLAMFYASIADGKEGVRAFLEKRRPRFRSRASSDVPDIWS